MASLEEAVSAADANRRFSELLRTVKEGRSVVVTSHGKTTVMINAADLAADHHLGIWDSVIIAATAEAGCRLLLSEDLQEGLPGAASR